MCQYRLDQHLIVLNLYNILVNKILVTAFVKVSQNLSLMQKMPESNWMFGKIKHSKSKTSRLQKSMKYKKQLNRVQNSWIKVLNTKLPNIWMGNVST